MGLVNLGGVLSGFNRQVGGLFDDVTGGHLAFERSLLSSQIARDWMERMSNSAHQRQVADLRAAGLNPILSVRGQGAPVPSASAAAGQSSAGQGIQALSSFIPQMRAVSTAASVAKSQVNANNAAATRDLANAKLAQSRTNIRTDIGADADSARRHIQKNISTGAKAIKRTFDKVESVRIVTGKH